MIVLGATLLVAGAPIHPDMPWARDLQRPPAVSAAYDYEPVPGILVVKSDGFSVQSCGIDHAGLGCSTLVPGDTNIPAYGGEVDLLGVSELLRPYQVTVTDERPPSWVPYTQVVVGGGPSQSHVFEPACSSSVIECGGRSRHNLGFVFPDDPNCGSFGGVSLARLVVSAAAQAWGLETVQPPLEDLPMLVELSGYCEELAQDPPVCSAEHRSACGEAGMQDAAAELLAMFGPRDRDIRAPQLVEVSPQRDRFNTRDTILVSARVEENTRFLAVKWTWDEGLAPGIESHSKCTNDACDARFPLELGFDPNETTWDFVELSGPPPGRYSFTFEARDAPGHTVTRTVSFEVVDPTPSGVPPPDTDGEPDQDETESGCGCATGPVAPATPALLFALLAVVRRRR